MEVFMVIRHFRYASHAVDIPPLIRLWLLRILVPLGGQRKFLSPDGFAIDAWQKPLVWG